MGEVIEEIELAMSRTLLMLDNKGSLYVSDTCKSVWNFKPGEPDLKEASTIHFPLS